MAAFHNALWCREFHEAVMRDPELARTRLPPEEALSDEWIIFAFYSAKASTNCLSFWIPPASCARPFTFRIKATGSEIPIWREASSTCCRFWTRLAFLSLPLT